MSYQMTILGIFQLLHKLQSMLSQAAYKLSISRAAFIKHALSRAVVENN
jgi:hypothetical protein